MDDNQNSNSGHFLDNGNESAGLEKRLENSHDIVRALQNMQQQQIDIQRLQMELKGKEIEIVQQDNHNKFSYSCLVIEKTAADKKEKRETVERIFNKAVIAASIVFLAFITFMAYTVFLGKDSLTVKLFEIILNIFNLSAGAGLGYFAGSRKKRPHPPEADDD